MTEESDPWMDLLLSISHSLQDNRHVSAATQQLQTRVKHFNKVIADGKVDGKQESRPRSVTRSPRIQPSNAITDEMDNYFKLNIIEPSYYEPHPCLPKQPNSQQASSTPTEAWSTPTEALQTVNKQAPIGLQHHARYPDPISQADAAARRICQQEFGSSNSVFVVGAMMSYLLKGSAANYDDVKSMMATLPARLQDTAEHTIRAVARIRGVRLMAPPSSPVTHAEQQIRNQLKINSSMHFYIGITERPIQRLQEHNASGYNQMWLYVFASSRGSGAAEQALIKAFRGVHGCQNIGKGNEHASMGQPHYLYIVWRPHVMSVRK
jgi:hypothetical protein